MSNDIYYPKGISLPKTKLFELDFPLSALHPWRPRGQVVRTRGSQEGSAMKYFPTLDTEFCHKYCVVLTSCHRVFKNECTQQN